MTSTATFSDLLAQLATVHASEIQDLRDECAAAMALAKATQDCKAGCKDGDIRSHWEAQESENIDEEPLASIPVSKTPIATLSQNIKSEGGQLGRPIAEISNSFDLASPTSHQEPLASVRASKKQITISCQKSVNSNSSDLPSPNSKLSVCTANGKVSHFLRPGWSRQAIWGAEDISLSPVRGTYKDRTSIQSLVLPTKAAGTFLCCVGFVIFPSGTFRTCWDMVSLVFIVIDVLTLPYIFAFEPRPSTFYGVISWSSLIFWTFDMAQGPFLGYFFKGEYVSSKPRILKHYLKTWFIIDIAVVGPEWLGFFANSGNDNQVSNVSGLIKVFKSIRIIRVLRLLRLAKVKRLIQTLYDMSNSESSFVLLNVVQLVIFLLILNHVLACAWHKIGVSSKTDDYNDWISRILLANDNVTPYYLYLTSMHWSLTQFTPASMDVSATNEAERLFSIIVLFCAMIVFSSFVGSITNHITRLRTLRSDSTKQLWLLRRFFRDHRVSSHLAHRIQKYVEHKLTLEAGQLDITEMDILSSLSPALSEELSYDMHSRYVCAHPFFHRLGNSMGYQVMVLHRVCQAALRVDHYAKEELVFSAGEEAKYMFIVQSGTLFYNRVGADQVMLSMDEQHDVAETEVIGWIAEAVLWTAWRHRGELHVGLKHASELIAMDPSVFFDVMSKHPRSWLYATVYGEEFVAFINNVALLTDVITSQDFYEAAAEQAYTIASDGVPQSRDGGSRQQSPVPSESPGSSETPVKM